jgi:hypothetical protein
MKFEVRVFHYFHNILVCYRSYTNDVKCCLTTKRNDVANFDSGIVMRKINNQKNFDK